ncbi:hypothetical protein WN55_09485 [Dufourea novaeangliae]|uniref:Uncharacterized protein n=1 Tax=Dufourea novaeangliae TaxID=178035 RepID=A0A154NYD1_DUFNO|nr:hypothetical protein WN55_09485 [Dufourea novaeangliae]
MYIHINRGSAVRKLTGGAAARRGAARRGEAVSSLQVPGHWVNPSIDLTPLHTY